MNVRNDVEFKEIEELFKKIAGGGTTDATDEDKTRLYQAVVDGQDLPDDWKRIVEHYLTVVLKSRSPDQLKDRARLEGVRSRLLTLIQRSTPPPDGTPPPAGPRGSGGAPRDDKAGARDPGGAPAPPADPAGGTGSGTASSARAGRVLEFARARSGRGTDSRPLPKTVDELLREIGVNAEIAAQWLKHGRWTTLVRMKLALMAEVNPARFEALSFELEVLDEYLQDRRHEFRDPQTLCRQFLEGSLAGTGSGSPLTATTFLEGVVREKVRSDEVRTGLREVAGRVRDRIEEKRREERARERRERVK